LSLQEALKAALENNFQVQIATEARASSSAGVAIAQGAFDLTLVSGLSYGRQDSATTRSLYPTGPLARTEATTTNRNLMLGAQKPFEWGGNLQVSYSPGFSYAKGDYQDPNTQAYLGRFGTKYPYSASLTGTYTQSLLRGFGRPVNEVNVIVAKKSSQAADYQFSLAMINLVAAAETQYWDLVYAGRNLANTQAALALAQEQLDDNRAKAKAGTLAEIEVTSAQAAAARQKQALIAAKAQLRNAHDALLRTLYPRAKPGDRLEPSEAPDLSYAQVEATLAEKLALDRRIELKVAKLARESMGALRVAAENRLLPQLNAFVTYSATSDNRASLGPVNGDLSGGAYPGYGVGLTFSFPLANRAAKGSVAQARANERGSELSLRDLELGITLQVRQAVETVEASREGVEAARVTRTFREEDLRAEQKKFENGMSTTFLVLFKQNDLDLAKAAELQAQIGYAKARMGMELATGNLLEARGFSSGK
jgi:outer membrane protein TolC